MAISGGDILLELFERNDIEYVFSSPGSEWVPVWEGLARRHKQGDKTIKYINCRHETLAVSMAASYAKATGSLPAVLLHDSVGPLNGAMAIRSAYRSRSPMIICGTNAISYCEDEDGKALGWQWPILLSDMVGPDALIRPYSKWSNVITSKETLLDSVCRGCHIAQTAPQGPVFLTVPSELLVKSMPEVKIMRSSLTTALPQLSAIDLEKVAKRLVESKQPIIITEYAGKSAEAADKLVELAELLKIPVFECINPAFTNFPKNHPLHMGYDASDALKESDTVLVIGGSSPWQPPSAFPQNNTQVILVDEDPLRAQLPYFGYRIDSLISADLGQWLAALIDTVRNYISKAGQPGSVYQSRLQQWQARHQQLTEQWKAEALAGQESKPISPRWFFYIINKLLPNDSIVLEETITHKPFILRYLTEPTCYFDHRSGGLGIGLGMAAGVKLAHKDSLVTLLVGDGSFNYNPVLAGLGLCQEYHLPILIIVLNNGGYMAMRRSHRQYYPDGWAVSNNTYFGVDITPAPDYIKIAEAFNAYGERLEEPDKIEPALNRALHQIGMGKTALLDVMLDQI